MDVWTKPSLNLCWAWANFAFSFSGSLNLILSFCKVNKIPCNSSQLNLAIVNVCLILGILHSLMMFKYKLIFSLPPQTSSIPLPSPPHTTPKELRKNISSSKLWITISNCNLKCKTYNMCYFSVKQYVLLIQCFSNGL